MASFSFSSRWHHSAQESPYALHPISQQSPPPPPPPKGYPQNSANICLVEQRLFPTSDGGMPATSFLHSSFLQAISAVMLWPFHVQKVRQASEHLCPAKLQTRCDICCAYQSICSFIPTDSREPRTIDPQKYLKSNTVYGCVPVAAAHSRLHLIQDKSVRMMACVFCASCWEVSYCIACVIVCVCVYIYVCVCVCVAR